MNILGIGSAEFILILILAGLILGPRRLPRVALKAGKTVRELRQMSTELMRQWKQEAGLAAQANDFKALRTQLKETHEGLVKARRRPAETASTLIGDPTGPLKDSQPGPAPSKPQPTGLGPPAADEAPLTKDAALTKVAAGNLLLPQITSEAFEAAPVSSQTAAREAHIRAVIDRIKQSRE